MTASGRSQDGPRWRAAISIQMFFIQVAWVGSRIMLGYRAIEAGEDATFVAVLASAFAAPALAGSVAAGRLADRFGGAWVGLVGTALMTLGCVIPVLRSDSWLLLVAAVAIGLGSVGVFVGQQAFIAVRNAGRGSDSDFGNLATAASVGQLVAPPVITTVAAFAATAAHPDTTLGLLLCGFTGVVAMGPGINLVRTERRIPRSSAQDDPPQSTMAVMRTPGLWQAIAVSSAMLVTMDLLYTFVPLWAAERGINSTVVGWLLALRALVSVSSRLGLGRLVATFGRKVPLVFSMACGVVALVALPFSGVTAAFFAMVGLGVSLGVPQPLTLAWIVEIVPRRDHGAALGLRMAGNRLGQTVIPLAMSVVAASMGVAGVIWANAVTLGAATILAAMSDPGGKSEESKSKQP